MKYFFRLAPLFVIILLMAVGCGRSDYNSGFLDAEVTPPEQSLVGTYWFMAVEFHYFDVDDNFLGIVDNYLDSFTHWHGQMQLSQNSLYQSWFFDGEAWDQGGPYTVSSSTTYLHFTVDGLFTVDLGSGPDDWGFNYFGEVEGLDILEVIVYLGFDSDNQWHVYELDYFAKTSDNTNTF